MFSIVGSLAFFQYLSRSQRTATKKKTTGHHVPNVVAVYEIQTLCLVRYNMIYNDIIPVICATLKAYNS